MADRERTDGGQGADGWRTKGFRRVFPRSACFPRRIGGNRARIRRVTLRSRPLNPFGGRRDQRNERSQEPPANKKKNRSIPWRPSRRTGQTSVGAERPPSTPRVDQGGPSGCFIRAGPLLSHRKRASFTSQANLFPVASRFPVAIGFHVASGPLSRRKQVSRRKRVHVAGGPRVRRRRGSLRPQPRRVPFSPRARRTSARIGDGTITD